MAKSTRVNAQRALSAARAFSAEAFSAGESKKLSRLTERFFALREQLARDAVETVREMGEVLERAAALLPGTFGRWAQEVLGISLSAARNYRRVAALAASTPAIFIEHKDLGTSKMIRLSRIPAPKRQRALQQKLDGKTAGQMTDADFAIATKPFVAQSRTVTGNMRMHGLLMKLQAMTKTLHAAGSTPRAKNRELRATVRAELDELLRAARTLKKNIC